MGKIIKIDNDIKLSIDYILFLNGITQKEKTKIYNDINEHLIRTLLKFDKWCENYSIEDIKLTSDELIDKFIKQL